MRDAPIILPFVNLKSDEQIARERAEAEALRLAEREAAYDAMTDEERARVDEWDKMNYTERMDALRDED